METEIREDGTSVADREPRRGIAGFWALIATQFQRAFSDNALKWLVSFLVLEAGVSREQRDFLFVLVVPLVFAVPFLVFSIPGGYFADRFSKRSVTMAFVLARMLPELWPSALHWTRLRQRASV